MNFSSRGDNLIFMFARSLSLYWSIPAAVGGTAFGTSVILGSNCDPTSKFDFTRTVVFDQIPTILGTDWACVLPIAKR